MKKKQPRLMTPRMVLRPFRAEDAPAVQQLAGHHDIASTTLSIPHPYPDGVAELWISSHASKYAEGVETVFALTLRASGDLIGAMGFEENPRHDWAEIGYWIGRPFWGQGYATEALRSFIQWTFAHTALNRLQSCHFMRNPASGRVMQKAGMTREGIMRQRVKKWGHYEDIAIYAILRSEAAGPT